jgi:transposase
MDFVGIDLHKTSSQICILSEGGELKERRIKTTRASFDEVFARKPPARILVEASTESEWVAGHLEALGHEVIVADPNFAPMYATRDKKIKTDKRDARALCEACRLGAYRPAHRTSEGSVAKNILATISSINETGASTTSGVVRNFLQHYLCNSTKLSCGITAGFKCVLSDGVK